MNYRENDCKRNENCRCCFKMIQAYCYPNSEYRCEDYHDDRNYRNNCCKYDNRNSNNHYEDDCFKYDNRNYNNYEDDCCKRRTRNCCFHNFW